MTCNTVFLRINRQQEDSDESAVAAGVYFTRELDNTQLSYL